MTETIAIRARWVLLPDGPRQRIEADRWVLVEGGRIAAVTRDRPGGADRVIDAADALVLPGFVNLHNHGISALLFRGIVEDRPTASWAADTVYGLIMPLQGLAMEVLDADELRAVTALGLLGPVKGGATTTMDMFRIAQAVSFDAADALGMRFYGMPYLFSTEDLGIGADGRPQYAARGSGESDLARAAALFDAHDGRADGRIRAGFGPHGTDSCDADLLAAIRDAAAERGAKVTIHVSQSATEGETLQSRYGRTPAGQLAHVGLLGPDLIAAHCVYASDDDLDLIGSAGATVVNCPASFARGAVSAVWQRTAARGIRTGIGLDGYSMDTIGELRTAALVSKLASGLSEDAAARDLVAAATVDGAAALGRDGYRPDRAGMPGRSGGGEPRRGAPRPGQRPAQDDGLARGNVRHRGGDRRRAAGGGEGPPPAGRRGRDRRRRRGGGAQGMGGGPRAGLYPGGRDRRIGRIRSRPLPKREGAKPTSGWGRARSLDP